MWRESPENALSNVSLANRVRLVHIQRGGTHRGRVEMGTQKTAVDSLVALQQAKQKQSLKANAAVLFKILQQLWCAEQPGHITDNTLSSYSGQYRMVCNTSGYITDNTLISYSGQYRMVCNTSRVHHRQHTHLVQCAVQNGVQYSKGTSQITHSSCTVCSTERCAIHQGYITDNTLISYSGQYRMVCNTSRVHHR